MYLSTLINNIVPLGFTADQFGLVVRTPPARPPCATETPPLSVPAQAYNQHFTALMNGNDARTEELKGLHKQIWETLLAKSFGVEFEETIDLEEARKIQARSGPPAPALRPCSSPAQALFQPCCNPLLQPARCGLRQCA